MKSELRPIPKKGKRGQLAFHPRFDDSFRATKLPWQGGGRIVNVQFMVYLAKRVVLISEELTKIGLSSMADGEALENTKSEIKNALENIARESDFLGLRLTNLATVRFLKSLNNSKSEEIWSNFLDVKSRFEDEVQLIQFIFIPLDKMAFYNKESAFGEEVAKAFPSAYYDIKEASNCFALERHTATVMHSMRVLECGLNALGKMLKVKRSIHGWGGDLKAFQAQWEKMINFKPPKKLGWKRQFCPQLFLHFRHFADAWRNRAFHKPGDQYGEGEAQVVFNHVRDFMKLLATRLSER